MWRIAESSCERKETADIDIFVTSRNGDRKNMQSIGIASRSPLRIRKWNQLSQFRWTSTKVIRIKKLRLATFRQWAKGQKEAASERPTVLHICFLRTRSPSPNMTTVFHAWLYGRFIDTGQPHEKKT